MQDKTEQSTLKMSINQSFIADSQQSKIHLPDTPTLSIKSSSIQSFQMVNQQMIHRKQILKLIELKEQILVIRQRISVIPKVPDPQIVNHFKALREIKEKLVTKQKLKDKIQQKKKQLSKLKVLYAKSQLQFDQKNQIFKQKSALLRVLGTKMQTQLSKTKERYRQVQFNRVIVQGVRKLLYFRLSEILFNDNIRGLFNVLNITNPNEQKDEDNMGNCLGYLTLFVSLVGNISGARMWINFTFKGPKSTIKLLDGSTLTLHPKQPKLAEGLKLLNEQLYQIMKDTMQLKVINSQNFYQLCEELSKQILSLR